MNKVHITWHLEGPAAAGTSVGERPGDWVPKWAGGGRWEGAELPTSPARFLVAGWVLGLSRGNFVLERVECRWFLRTIN